MSTDPARAGTETTEATKPAQASGLPFAHSWPVRLFLRLLAVISLGLGIIGVFVPGLPTTVFVLIAAWAAARSSPRLHAWLLQHRVFGPLLDNWSHGRRVSRRAKWTAAIVMSLSGIWLGYAVRPGALAAALILCMFVVLAWLWSRPEPAGPQKP